MEKAKRNPFKPTAGVNPPELIGRQNIINEFTDSLDNGVGAPYRLMRISGIRGVGKTALLNALGKIAREDYNFTVINVTSEPGICDRIAEELSRLLPNYSVNAEPEVLGIKLGSVSVEKRPAANLSGLLCEASRARGVFITVDEIQDIELDELRVLGNNVQLAMREEANIAFAFAGLPSAIDAAVNHQGITFLQRAASVQLERLNNRDVEASFRETIESWGLCVSGDVVQELARAADGYPFMVQLVGYYAWQSAIRRNSDVIEAGDAARGIENARENFIVTVVEPTLSRLTAAQREYLTAMARVEDESVQSGAVADMMNRDVTGLAGVRSSLIRSGVIETAGYGKARFTIPYMRPYLCEAE